MLATWAMPCAIVSTTSLRRAETSRLGESHGADALVDDGREPEVSLEQRGDGDVLPSEMFGDQDLSAVGGRRSAPTAPGPPRRWRA
jgi:hypothetical protein